MIYDFILFSVFASLSVISATMVISLSNAVHSVLFLIFLFCNMSSLLLLLGAEFLSLLFLIVYVGAIAVLFLFVVMMLNINIELSSSKNYLKVLPIGFLLSIILALQILISIDVNFIGSKNIINSPEWILWLIESFSSSNVEALGFVLYTKYSLLFLLCGLVLLVSMLGVIVLTIHQKTKLKKQNITIQVYRVPRKTIKFSSLN